ncbi:MAG: tRNA epoxyqueuosine(34) reductase QueG [Verrucomicrobiota bacterium]
MKNLIQAKARELGFDACHFTSAAPPEHAGQFQKWLKASQHGEMHYLQRNAEKRVDPQRVLSEAKSIVTLGVSYFPGETETVSADANERGVVARYARYGDYHEIIGDRLKSLVEFVNTLGEETRSLWYVDTGPLLERDFAQRAGLGFIGKHTNVISRKLGNWIFLSEIITTLEIAPDFPEKNRCGSCIRCLAACPTQAITAPFQLDARRCISYLTIELKGSIPLEFRAAIGSRIYGCDDCLAACPWNRFAQEGKLMAAHAKKELAAPGLLDLLALDEENFKKRFSGTPILRTKRRGLLRNVCVALGNVGDERALPVLERAVGDAEPLITEHASWAIQQIEKRIGRN